MHYAELLRNRRAVRGYEDKSVPLETFEAILKESCLAPSSGNRQEWRLIVVNNRELIKRISDESKRNKLKEIEENPSIYMSKYKEELGITEELQLVAPVILGYPKEIPPIPEREDPQILKILS